MYAMLGKPEVCREQRNEGTHDQKKKEDICSVPFLKTLKNSARVAVVYSLLNFTLAA